MGIGEFSGPFNVQDTMTGKLPSNSVDLLQVDVVFFELLPGGDVEHEKAITSPPARTPPRSSGRVLNIEQAAIEIPAAC